MAPSWGHFRPLRRPSRLLTPHFVPNMNFHEISAGVVRGAFPGPQDGLRSTQDRFQDVSFPLLNFDLVLGSILVCFGSPQASLGHPSGDQNRTKIDQKINRKLVCAKCPSKIAPRPPKTAPGAPQDRPRPPQDPPQGTPRPPKTTMTAPQNSCIGYFLISSPLNEDTFAESLLEGPRMCRPPAEGRRPRSRLWTPRSDAKSGAITI